MDNIDNQIIHAMERNARQSSNTIAEKINVSSATVRRRLKRLIDANELHIEAHRDPIKAGFPVSALMGLNIEHSFYSEVVEKLSNIPEVSWLSITTGRFDGFIFANFPSNEALFTFITDIIINIQGIKDVETFMCLHTNKWVRFH